MGADLIMIICKLIFTLLLVAALPSLCSLLDEAENALMKIAALAIIAATALALVAIWTMP